MISPISIPQDADPLFIDHLHRGFLRAFWQITAKYLRHEPSDPLDASKQALSLLTPFPCFFYHHLESMYHLFEPLSVLEFPGHANDDPAQIRQDDSGGLGGDELSVDLGSELFENSHEER